jgi:hypothetical protein
MTGLSLYLERKAGRGNYNISNTRPNPGKYPPSSPLSIGAKSLRFVMECSSRYSCVSGLVFALERPEQSIG